MEELDEMVHIPIVGVIAMEYVVVVIVVVVRDGKPENEVDSKAPQVSQE